MEIIVSGHHVSVTQPLKEYASKKYSKVNKYFDNIQEVKIELNVIDTKVLSKRQECSVIVSCSGTHIKAKQSSPDMYASIDMVFEKIVKQLKKYKDKIKKRKKVKIPPKKVIYSLKEDVKPEPRIIKTKMFAQKPMTTEEAIMQIDALKKDFFVFINSDSSDVNVIYKRKDGNYGLIESEF